MTRTTVARRQKSPAGRRTAFGVAGLALGLLAGCGSSDSPSAGRPGAPAVTVVPVVSRKIPLYADFVGQTEAKETVEIRARVAGFLERVAFTEGAEVRRGALLFVIDPRPYEAALQEAKAQLATAEAALVKAREGAEIPQAQAALAQSEAALAKARQDVARYRPLVEQEALSRRQLDDALAREQELVAAVAASQAALTQARVDQRARIEQADAAVAASRAAVTRAELNLAYTRMEAPLDGWIGRTAVNVGSLVGQGEPTLLATISRIEPIYANFSVSERQYLEYAKERVRRAQAIGPSERPVQLVLQDDALHPYPGRIDLAEPRVEPGTGTLRLRAEFPNPQKVLRPGQFVKVRVLVNDQADAILIPQRAVQEVQGVRSVLVVAADNTVEYRKVVVGPRSGSLWVVEDGLKPGERVIVEGQAKVRPGLQVSPSLGAEPDPPAPAATPGGAPRPPAGR